MALIGPSSKWEHWTIDNCVSASEDHLDFINFVEKLRGSSAALGSVTPVQNPGKASNTRGRYRISPPALGLK